MWPTRPSFIDLLIVMCIWQIINILIRFSGGPKSNMSRIHLDSFPRLQPLLLVPTSAPWNVSPSFKSTEIDLKGPPYSSRISPSRWNFVDSRRCHPTMTNECTFSPILSGWWRRYFPRILKPCPRSKIFCIIFYFFCSCSSLSHWSIRSL